MDYSLLVSALYFSLGVYLSMAFVVLFYKGARGAMSYIILMLASSIYTLGYAFELRSFDIETALLWIRIEYIGIAIIPAIWLIFVLQYCGKDHWLKRYRFMWGLIWIIPIITLILINTNHLHNLFYADLSLKFINNLSIVVIDRGIFYWINAIFYNVAFLIGSILLFDSYFKTKDEYKNRYLILFIGSLVPWVLLIVYLLGIGPLNMDLGPFSIALTGFIYIYNLFRYRVFDMFSQARINVFKSSLDSILLFDSEDRLTDMNDTALRYFGKDCLVLGIHSYNIINKEVLKQQSLDKSIQTTIETAMGLRWVDMRISSIKKNNGKTIGKIFVIRDITDNKIAEEALRESETKHRRLVSTMQIGLALHEIILDNMGKPIDYRFLEVNDSYEKLTGLFRDRIIGKTVREVLPNTEEYWIDNFGKVALTGETIRYENYSNEIGKYFETIAYQYKPFHFVVLVNDITERKHTEKKLSHEKERLSVTLHSIGDAVITTDKEGRIVIFNNMAEKLTGWSKKDTKGRDINQVFNIIEDTTGKRCSEPLKEVLETGNIIKRTNNIQIISKNGTNRPIAYNIAPIKEENGVVIGTVLVFRDISKEKRKLERIKYLSYHDGLTGLYNRRYFEEQLKRLDVEENLPISIIIADVNGLKLTNDAFGHMTGDKVIKQTANIIKNSCRDEDIIARWGGDEFIVLLPNITSNETEMIVRTINDILNNKIIDSIYISVAIGWDTKNSIEENMVDVFKKAEDYMYRHKMAESPSMRGKTIYTMLNSMCAKSEEEEKHSQRVSQLCEAIGKKMGFDDKQLNELKTVGLLHDIGKTAVDENILTKKAKLTDNEWNDIKRHPETGHRIMNSVNEMSEMSEYILAHHERLDGKGYPCGLKGDEIPIQARIIAIADAYDAMTSKRTYKRTLSKKEAIDELINNSGTQFDKDIVEVFVRKVLKEDLE